MMGMLLLDYLTFYINFEVSQHFIIISLDQSILVH